MIVNKINFLWKPKTVFQRLLDIDWERRIRRTSTTSLMDIISKTKNPAKLQDFEDSTSRRIYRIVTYIKNIAIFNYFINRIPRSVGPGSISLYHGISFPLLASLPAELVGGEGSREG